MWFPVTTAWRVLGLRKKKRPSVWWVAANVLNKHSGQPTRDCPPAWELGEVLTTPRRKNRPCYETDYFASVWAEPLVQIKQWKMYMTFTSTWNVRSLCWSGSFTAVYRESAKYKLDLVGVHEVRWDKGGTVRKTKIICREQDFLYTTK